MEKKKILVIISGGAVQDIVFPSGLEGVELEIRDYDVDSTDEAEYIKKDEDGESYQEMIFPE